MFHFEVPEAFFSKTVFFSEFVEVFFQSVGPLIKILYLGLLNFNSCVL